MGRLQTSTLIVEQQPGQRTRLGRIRPIAAGLCVLPESILHLIPQPLIEAPAAHVEEPVSEAPAFAEPAAPIEAPALAPYDPAPVAPAPVAVPPVPPRSAITNQMIISALYRAGGGAWGLFDRAGLSLRDLAARRTQPYSGPPLSAMDGLTADEQEAVQRELDSHSG